MLYASGQRLEEIKQILRCDLQKKYEMIFRKLYGVKAR